MGHYIVKGRARYAEDYEMKGPEQAVSPEGAVKQLGMQDLEEIVVYPVEAGEDGGYTCYSKASLDL